MKVLIVVGTVILVLAGIAGLGRIRFKKYRLVQTVNNGNMVLYIVQQRGLFQWVPVRETDSRDEAENLYEALCKKRNPKILKDSSDRPKAVREKC